MPIRAIARVPLAMVVLCCLFSSGCGGQKALRLTGKVTFKGQPVPAGKIYFYPDARKGNIGQVGYAEIKNGEYDTRAAGGQATIGGPTRVAIQGWDPSAPADPKDGEGGVKSLFAEYEVEVDLPTEDGTKDFDVPATATNPPKPQPKKKDIDDA